MKIDRSVCVMACRGSPCFKRTAVRCNVHRRENHPDMWHTWNLTCTHMHSVTRQLLLHVLDTLHFYKAWKILKLKKGETPVENTVTHAFLSHTHTHINAHTDTLKGRRSRKHNQNARCPSNEEDNGIKLKFLSPRVFLSICLFFSARWSDGEIHLHMRFCSLRSFEGRPPGLRGKQFFLSRSLHRRRGESLSICPSVWELRISRAVWRCGAATAASGSRCSPWRWAPDCHLQTPYPNTDYCSHVPGSASVGRERPTYTVWAVRAKTPFRMKLLLYIAT